MARESIALSNLKLQPFTAFGPEGILLVAGSSAAAGSSNPMTISWGSFGVMWERPVVSVLVRPSRHTHGIITRVPDFTLNWLPEHLLSAVNICGQASGRNGSKWDAARIKPVPSSKSASPIVDECLLALECKILHRQALDPSGFVGTGLDIFYPSGDIHTLIIGELIAAQGTEAFKSKPS